MFPVYCKTCKKVVHYFSDYDEAKKKNEKGFECFSCFAKRNIKDGE